MELDIYRFELGISYAIDDRWDATLRVPYFIKDQRTSVEFPFGGTAAERAAAIANGQIHHRTETYRGFSDWELAAGWRKQHVFGTGTVMRASIGLTVPVGATEENTLTAGAAGLRHLHIQFGNGTVDPILDFYAGFPFHSKWAASIFAKARLPFYENGNGFRGAPEGLISPRVTWLPHKRFSLSGGVAAGVQGYTYWDGVKDPNSGQFTLNSIFSAGYRLTDQITGSLSFLHPIHSISLGGEDEFKAGPTVSMSVGYSF